MIRERKGNIFTTEAQTIVNTVNCVGVMGAGIAYEFRLRHPEMYRRYADFCKMGEIEIGKLWIYRPPEREQRSGYRQVLNFPTKRDWKHPSKEEYLRDGLQKFRETYRERGITSVAFPLLGADKGGITPRRSLDLMKEYLAECDLDVEIWHFDPHARDDLYEAFRNLFAGLDEEGIRRMTGLRRDKIRLLVASLGDKGINSFSGLLRVRGIGAGTVEKLFEFFLRKREPNLFDFCGTD